MLSLAVLICEAAVCDSCHVNSLRIVVVVLPFYQFGVLVRADFSSPKQENS